METINLAAQGLCGFLGGAIFIGWMAGQRRAAEVAKVAMLVVILAIPFAMALQMAYASGVQRQWFADNDRLLEMISTHGERAVSAARALSAKLPTQYSSLPFQSSYMQLGDFKSMEKLDATLVTGRTFLFLLGLLVASLIARFAGIHAGSDEDADPKHASHTGEDDRHV